MILTHFLALIASPALLIDPAPAASLLASSEPLVSSGGLEVALVSALKVRATATTLPVREH